MNEHTQTRLPLINELEKLGWDKNQIQFMPEWKVPKTPSDASKRESNQSFQGFSICISFESLFAYILYIPGNCQSIQTV